MDHAIELRHLRYLCAVAEELHFGRAAARLGLSQPPLSLQIRQLEEAAGARLFDRHSRRVALTDAGRALHDAARRILREVDAALVSARQAGAGEVGELRVAFAPTLMLSPLAHVIRRYRARYPGVRVELRELPSAEQTAALLRGDLDVAFVRDAETDERLHVEPIAREALLIALSPDHPLAARSRVPLAALAGEPWVMFPRAIAPRLHEHVMQMCREAGFTPRVVQESRETYTTIGLVGAGVGVTVVPAAVERMGWEGVVYKPIPRAFTQLGMVWPAGPVRAVVDTFLTVARATSAAGDGITPTRSARTPASPPR